MNEILVKYFSGRMLGTLDLGQLFRSLFDEFGECQVSFVPMTLQEKSEASSDIDGIELVNERYRIFHRVGADFVRRPDIEKQVVRIGQK